VLPAISLAAAKLFTHAGRTVEDYSNTGIGFFGGTLPDPASAHEANSNRKSPTAPNLILISKNDCNCLQPGSGISSSLAPVQFTNLLTLTEFTKPSIRKVDQTLEPP
jgi:hypothetical protein